MLDCFPKEMKPKEMVAKSLSRDHDHGWDERSPPGLEARQGCWLLCDQPLQQPGQDPGNWHFLLKCLLRELFHLVTKVFISRS